MQSNAMIEMRGITKHFGSVVANENVDLTVRRGEILSVLGENGSGKTSLMNMLPAFTFRTRAISMWRAARWSSARPRTPLTSA